MHAIRGIIIVAVVLCVCASVVSADGEFNDNNNNNNNKEMVKRYYARRQQSNFTASESWGIITSSETADLGLYDGYFLDTSSNSITLTMPDLTGLDGARFGVKRTISNLNTATVVMYSGQTIDGSASRALIPATMNGLTCMILDGDLFIIASH